MYKRQSLDTAFALWAEGEIKEASRVLKVLARELEEQRLVEQALALYSFLVFQIGDDAVEDIKRLNQQGAFADLALLQEIFLLFFPTENPTLEFEEFPDPDRKSRCLNECERHLEVGNWRSAADSLLEAACSVSNPETICSMVMRVLELRPDNKQALALYSKHKNTWNEISTQAYIQSLDWMYPQTRSLLYEAGSADFSHLEPYQQATIHAARKASEISNLDIERCRLADVMLHCLRRSALPSYWKFLKSVESSELVHGGWRSWLLGRLLEYRNPNLLPEVSSHLRDATRQMTGSERFLPLVDLARSEKDVAWVGEAAIIARQQTPQQKAALFNQMIKALLRIGTRDAHKAAVTYSKELCKVAESSFGTREIGLCWERKGRALMKLGDAFRAEVAFRKAKTYFSKNSDRSRIFEHLASVAKRREDFVQALEYAQEAADFADRDSKVGRLMALAEAYADLFNFRAAASRYAQTKKHILFDSARLAELYFQAGREADAFNQLNESKSVGKARVYYQLGDLQQARRFGRADVIQLVQAEQADHRRRESIRVVLAERALARLKEPTRSLVKGRLQRDDLVLHSQEQGRSTRQLRILPLILVGMGRDTEAAERVCKTSLDAIVEFHQREFGRWVAAPRIEKPEIILREWEHFYPRSEPDWHIFILDLMKDLRIRSRAGNQVVMVFHVSPHEGGEFRGVACTSTGVGHVWVCKNRFVDKVAVHEFLHAYLELKHSHGVHAPDEPRCVMTQGERALSTCFLQPFQKAVCLTPRFVHRLIHKGVRALNDGRWGDSIDHFKEAFLEDPLHEWLARKLADVLVRECRFAEACEVLKRHALYSRSLESKALMLDMLAFTGQLDEAYQVERRWPRGDELHSSLLRLVYAWKFAGHFARSLAIATNSLSLVDYSSAFFEEIGHNRWMMGHLRAAELAYLEAAERGRKGMASCLALIACERGDLSRARRYFREGETDFQQITSYYLRFRFALKEGDRASAQAALGAIERVSKATEWIQVWKFVFSYLNGETEPDDLETLRTYGVGFEQVWLARFFLSFLEGRPDTEILQTGLKLFPNEPRWNLARYLVDQRRVPRAFFHPSLLGSRFS